MAPSRQRRANTIGRWLFAFVVPASALCIGSLHTPVLIVAALLAATSATLLSLEPARRLSKASRWLLVACLVLIAATILQSIPLPASVVSFLAPGNAEVWQRALSPLREAGPSWHPLSVAPPATHVDLLRGVFYLCTFVAALRIACMDGGSSFLENLAIGSAAAIALVTLAHTAVHAETVFGLYRPRDMQGYLPGRIGPLLNPNHVAAYANIGALVAFGVALREQEVTRRILAGGAAVLVAGTSVWAGSRGGSASLLLGIVVVAALRFYAAKRREHLRSVEAGVVVLALVGAGVLVAVSASDVARQDLASADTSKLAVVRTAFRLVPLSPVFGTGRGSFETMFPLVREGSSYFTFLRPENIVAQWAIEWGIPAAVAASLFFAVALRPGVVLRSERPSVGPWVAIVVAVVHELVDFHLEVPGVVVLVLVCAAVVVGSRAYVRDRSTPSRLPRLLGLAALPMTLAAVLVVAPNVGHSLADDRDGAAKLAIDRSVARDAFVREVRAMMLRYPAEPFLPLAGAVRAQAVEDDNVIPWVGRALERYPAFGRAHLVLARSLAPRRRAQARLEYRLAYTYDEQLRPAVVREAPYVVDAPDSALELVPDGVLGVELLESLAAALNDRLPATASRLDEELSRRAPGATGPMKRRVAAAISDLTHAHPWCENRDACVEPAIRAARALIAQAPEKCESHALLARLLATIGRAREALDGFQSAVDKTVDRGQCLRELVMLSIQAGDRRRADAALDLVARSGCGSRSDCIDLYNWAAGIEQGRGNSVRAVSLYKRAAELTPEDDSSLLRIAELAEASGLSSEAIDAYSKLALRHPNDSRYRAKADEIRAKAFAPRSPRLP